MMHLKKFHWLCSCKALSSNSCSLFSHTHFNRFSQNASFCSGISVGVSSDETKKKPVLLSPFKVNIPKKIERKPTDLLKELSKTIGEDTSAYPNRYIDHPYTLPYYNGQFLRYAQARVMGIRAARYMIDKYPKFFPRRVEAEPALAFRSEDKSSMMNVYKMKRVKRFIHLVNRPFGIYDVPYLMQLYKRSIDCVNIEAFFQILCFFNSETPNASFVEKPMDELFLELHSETTTPTYSLSSVKEWQVSGFADVLWQELDKNKKTRRMYTILILGLVRHDAYLKAFNLFTEMRENSLALNLYVCNAMFKIMGSLPKPLIEDSLVFCENLLTEMCSLKICPNDETFVNILFSLLTSLSQTKALSEEAARNRAHLYFKFSKKVLEEMRYLGIEPSLSFCAYFIGIAHKSISSIESSRKSAMVTEFLITFLSRFQERRFSYNHKEDLQFFPFLTRILDKNCICDEQLALSIFEIYSLNSKFFQTRKEELGFVYSFLKFTIDSVQDFPSFIQIFTFMIPRKAYLNREILARCLDKIVNTNAYFFLPYLLPAIGFDKEFDYLKFLKFLSLKYDDICKEGEEVFQSIMSVLHALYEQIMNPPETRFLPDLSSVIFDDEVIELCTEILARRRDSQRAYAMFKCYLTKTKCYMTESTMNHLISALISTNSHLEAFDLIQDVRIVKPKSASAMATILKECAYYHLPKDKISILDQMVNSSHAVKGKEKNDLYSQFFDSTHKKKVLSTSA